MDSLRVKKHPVPVTIYLSDGTIESGTIFLPEQSAHHSGPATIAELMDDQDHFVRFKLPSDRFQMIGKTGVVAVKTVASPHATGYYDRTSALVRMVGRHAFVGDLLVEEGKGERVSDSIEETWQQMETEGGLAWLNRDHILVLETR